MSGDEGFDDVEKKILNLLYRKIGFLSTKQIAIGTGHAWETCIEALEELSKQGYVIYKEKKDPSKKMRRFWKFNYKKHRVLRSKKR